MHDFNLIFLPAFQIIFSTVKDETKIKKDYKHAELMGIDCLSKK